MQIEVSQVAVENKGKYKVATVTYKGPDGKVEQKNLMSFGDSKAAYDKLSQATQGDLIEVTPTKIANKDGKEFWHWLAPTVVGKAGISGKAGASNASPSASPRSTYETPEERARRQVLIVRQSSVSNAIAYCEYAKAKGGLDEVLKVAQVIADFVFQKGADEPVGTDYKVEIY